LSKFTDYYENQVIDHMLRNAAFTPPATLYLAAFTANTGLEANNPTNEVSATNYARQTCELNAAANGATYNVNAITFPEADEDWGTLTAVALCDHVNATNWGTDVNAVMWGDLTNSKTINTSDTFKMNSGDLDITVA
jgi:hypothetical protein